MDAGQTNRTRESSENVAGMATGASDNVPLTTEVRAALILSGALDSRMHIMTSQVTQQISLLIAKYEERFAGMENLLHSLVKSNQAMENRLVNLETTVDKIHIEQSRTEKHFITLNNSVQDTGNHLASMKTKVDEIRGDQSHLKNSFITLNNSVHSVGNSIVSLESVVDKIHLDQSVTENHFIKINDSVHTVLNRLGEMETMVNKLKSHTDDHFIKVKNSVQAVGNCLMGMETTVNKIKAGQLQTDDHFINVKDCVQAVGNCLLNMETTLNKVNASHSHAENHLINLNKSVQDVVTHLGSMETTVNKIKAGQLHTDDHFINVKDSVQAVGNCLLSIETTLNKINASHSHADNHFSNVNNSVQAVGKRLVSMEATLNKINAGQSHANNHFINLNSSVQAVGNQLLIMETAVNKVNVSQSHVENHFIKLNDSVHAVDNRLGSMETAVHNKLDNRNNSISTLDGTFKTTKNKVENTTRDQLQSVTVLDVTLRGNLTADEAMKIFPIAVQLQKTGLVDKLSQMLLKSLTKANCVTLFHFALEHKLKVLAETSQQMIYRSFKEISENGEDICRLSLEELKLIVFSESLSATEEHILKVITLWSHKRFQGLHHCVSELLPALRIPKCNLKFLEDLKQHFLLSDQTGFLEIVQKRIDELKSDDSDCQIMEIDEHREKPAAASTYKPPNVDIHLDTLFVMGGFSSLGETETFDLMKKKWRVEKISDSPSGWTWIGSFVNLILVVEVDNTRMRSYNTLTRSWKELAIPQPVFREGICLAQEGTHLYVLGGWGRGTGCDCYDITTGTWTLAGEMVQGRMNASATSLRGLVYCSGGTSELSTKQTVGNVGQVSGRGCASNPIIVESSPSNRRKGSAHGSVVTKALQILSSVEVYDPKQRCWSFISSMNFKRSRHCLASCNRFLWAVGGQNGTACIADVEKYDHKGWTRVKSIPTPRMSLSVSFFGGFLYAIGGSNENEDEEFFSTVEVYDPEKNDWTTGETLCHSRAYHGSCVATIKATWDMVNVTSK